MNEAEESIPDRLLPLARLLGAGLENDEIAGELGLAQHTVENYVSELRELLGARGRTDLAFKCMRLLG